MCAGFEPVPVKLRKDEPAFGVLPGALGNAVLVQQVTLRRHVPVHVPLLRIVGELGVPGQGTGHHHLEAAVVHFHNGAAVPGYEGLAQNGTLHRVPDGLVLQVGVVGLPPVAAHQVQAEVGVDKLPLHLPADAGKVGAVQLVQLFQQQELGGVFGPNTLQRRFV